MFGTLRYDAQNDDTHFIERTNDPLNGKGEGQRPRYSACDKCRAKKQRCGGRRDGCERCLRTSSECVYSLQGKGRGRRRRNATEPHNKEFSLSKSSTPDPAKKSTAAADNKTQQQQQRQTPPAPSQPATQNMDGIVDDPMSGFMAVDSLEHDLPTSGLMHSDTLPGFDGQSIDDYLEVNYMATMPAQQDFDPDFYFGNTWDSFDSTPVDSLSDISSVFDQSHLLQSRSDFDLNSHVSRSPLSSVQSYSDGLPSPQSTPQALPATPVAKPDAGTSSAVPPDGCRCLNTMVMLLEDLETKGRSVDTAALDSILVSQKEALGRCHTVLNCASCFLRPEYILLLGMVAERLAALCESTVAKYLEDNNEDVSSFSPDSALNKPIHDVKVSLGGYEIETPDERVGLVRLMIVMQLQSLRKFVEGVSVAVASRREGQAQVLKVQAAEQRLAKLIQRIRQSKI